MTIWKFPLVIEDEQVIKIPSIFEPLTVQIQYGHPVLWAKVSPESNAVKIKIRTFGTGHSGVTQQMKYIGTYQVPDTFLVFHVFSDGLA